MGPYSHFAITNNFFMTKAEESFKSKSSKGEVKLRFHYRVKTVGTEALDTTYKVSVEDCRGTQMKHRCARKP